MAYSNCCGAPVKWADICSDCGEHCEAIEEEDDEVDEYTKGCDQYHAQKDLESEHEASKYH